MMTYSFRAMKFSIRTATPSTWSVFCFNDPAGKIPILAISRGARMTPYHNIIHGMHTTSY